MATPHFALKRRSLLQSLAAFGLTKTVLSWAQAAWPSTTKITVPLPAGGAVDTIVRKLGEVLAVKLGTSVVVDNKLGASGLIAAKAAAAGAFDGSNMLYLHSGMVTVQAMSGRLDILSEFKPVTKIGASPQLLTVKADSPYKTQADLIAVLRAKPGKLNYGSGGVGSPTHLMYEWLEEYAPGIKATHVPFKGGTEVMVAVIQGDVDFGFLLPAVASEHIKTGKLRVLSVTSPKRMPIFPNIPTVSEAGATGYAYEPWGGMVVPIKTPDAVVAKLFEALKASVAAPEFVAANNRVGGLVDISASPAAFAAELKAAIAAEKKLVKKLDLKLE